MIRIQDSKTGKVVARASHASGIDYYLALYMYHARLSMLHVTIQGKNYVAQIIRYNDRDEFRKVKV